MSGHPYQPCGLDTAVTQLSHTARAVSQQQQAAFANHLLQDGEGKEPTVSDIGQDGVQLKDSMCLPCGSSVSASVQRVHGDVQQCSDPEFFMERSIGTP